MTNARLLVVIIASLSWAAFCGAANATGVRTGVSVGTFAGIQQGDYSHLLLKTADGKEESFFVLKVGTSVRPYIANPRKLKGRKIRVHWREQMENIPEAGGPMLIKSVERIEAQR